MYKPTFYITMEANPERFNPEGQGLASRLWSFTAPVTLKPSPSQELGVAVRMKCAGRPYWDANDPDQQRNWETIARPALANKLHSVVDVLEGCNVERYQHYEGEIHHVWLKLQLAPYELRIRLDADAEGTDYIPDVLALVDNVRTLANSREVAAFTEGEEAIAIYLPSRAEVDALAETRAAEAAAWAEWENAVAKGDAEAEGGTEADADAESTPGSASNAETHEPEPKKPTLAPGLVISSAEFVKPNGEGLVAALR